MHLIQTVALKIQVGSQTAHEFTITPHHRSPAGLQLKKHEIKNPHKLLQLEIKVEYLFTNEKLNPQKSYNKQ